jgi:hypothetical protein
MDFTVLNSSQGFVEISCCRDLALFALFSITSSKDLITNPTFALVGRKRSLSFAVAAVVDIVPSWFLFSRFCSTMPLPFTHNHKFVICDL